MSFSHKIIFGKSMDLKAETFEKIAMKLLKRFKGTVETINEAKKDLRRKWTMESTSLIEGDSRQRQSIRRPTKVFQEEFENMKNVSRIPENLKEETIHLFVSDALNEYIVLNYKRIRKTEGEFRFGFLSICLLGKSASDIILKTKENNSGNIPGCLGFLNWIKGQSLRKLMIATAEHAKKTNQL